MKKHKLFDVLVEDKTVHYQEAFYGYALSDAEVTMAMWRTSCLVVDSLHEPEPPAPRTAVERKLEEEAHARKESGRHKKDSRW